MFLCPTNHTINQIVIDSRPLRGKSNSETKVIGHSRCPRRHRPCGSDIRLPNRCLVIIHLALGRVRKPRLPVNNVNISISPMSHDNKSTHFDLPPGRPRPGLADETRPASVSSPLPPVVVVAMLAERLQTRLRHTLHLQETITYLFFPFVAGGGISGSGSSSGMMSSRNSNRSFRYSNFR